MVVTSAAGARSYQETKKQEELVLYNSTDKVRILTNTNFKEQVLDTNHSILVEFYNSYCGHCRRFAPSYKLLAENLYDWRDVLPKVAITCAEDDNNVITDPFTPQNNILAALDLSQDYAVTPALCGNYFTLCLFRQQIQTKLQAMGGCVKYFVGCTHCSKHFQVKRALFLPWIILMIVDVCVEFSYAFYFIFSKIANFDPNVGFIFT